MTGQIAEVEAATGPADKSVVEQELSVLSSAERTSQGGAMAAIDSLPTVLDEVNYSVFKLTNRLRNSNSFSSQSKLQSSSDFHLFACFM